MNELFASAGEMLNRFCTAEQQRFSKKGRGSEQALINAAQSGIQQGRKAGRKVRGAGNGTGPPTPPPPPRPRVVHPMMNDGVTSVYSTEALPWRDETSPSAFSPVARGKGSHDHNITKQWSLAQVGQERTRRKRSRTKQETQLDKTQPAHH